MKLLITLLVVALASVNSLRIDEGCEAKSIWEIDYKWNEYQLHFWTPTNRDPNEAMAITIHLEGQLFPITYDYIQVFRNETVLEKVREGARDIKRYPLHSKFLEGWTEFILTLDANYGIMHGGNLVLNESMEYRPSSLTLEGSNITINCQSDLRAWEVYRDPSTIPLENSKDFSLSFYSKKEYLPTIEIEERPFQLGLREGLLTTIPSKIQNLLPFEEYQLNFSCQKNLDVTMCSITSGNDNKLLEEMRLADLPKTVTVSGKGSNSFYVILRNAKNKQENVKIGTLEDSSNSCKGTYIASIILGVLTTILLIVVAGVFYKKWRANRSRHAKRNSKNIEDAERDETQIDVLLEDKCSTSSRSSSDSGVGHETIPLEKGIL